jgi:hypothetical protein
MKTVVISFLLLAALLASGRFAEDPARPRASMPSVASPASALPPLRSDAVLPGYDPAAAPRRSSHFNGG